MRLGSPASRHPPAASSAGDDKDSFEYNSIPHFFKSDISAHERSFFQEYKDSLDNNDFLYFSRFINYVGDKTAPPLFGNGQILGRFDSQRDDIQSRKTREAIKAEQALAEGLPIESVNSLLKDENDPEAVNGQNSAGLESDPDKTLSALQEAESKLLAEHAFSPTGNFTNFLLLNTTSSLSSTVPYIVPMRLSVTYSLEYSSEVEQTGASAFRRPLSMIKLLELSD